MEQSIEQAKRGWLLQQLSVDVGIQPARWMQSRHRRTAVDSALEVEAHVASEPASQSLRPQPLIQGQVSETRHIYLQEGAPVRRMGLGARLLVCTNERRVTPS